MKVARLGDDDLRSVIILGAGATRGEEFRGIPSMKPWVQPPLDGDFFEQVQRMCQHRDVAAELTVKAQRYFGVPQTVGLEQFLNLVKATEAVEAFEEGLSGVKALPGSLRQGCIGLFERVLPALFAEAIPGHGDLPTRHIPHCASHVAIAQRIMPGDAIISFNYDCLMDAVLCQHCSSWNAQRGYAVEAVEGRQAWSSPNAAEGESAVQLLKMHGSLNWKRRHKDEGRIDLQMATFDSATEFIVPPLAVKDEIMPGHEKQNSVLHAVWRCAWKKLFEADLIAVIGYSLPAADVLAHAHFTSAGEARAQVKPPQPLKRLVVADPSDEVKERITGVFQSAMDDNTRVNWLRGLNEFRDFIAGSWA